MPIYKWMGYQVIWDVTWGLYHFLFGDPSLKIKKVMDNWKLHQNGPGSWQKQWGKVTIIYNGKLGTKVPNYGNTKNAVTFLLINIFSKFKKICVCLSKTFQMISNLHKLDHFEILADLPNHVWFFRRQKRENIPIVECWEWDVQVGHS